MGYDVKVLPATGATVAGLYGYWAVALGIAVAVFFAALLVNKLKRIK